MLKIFLKPDCRILILMAFMFVTPLKGVTMKGIQALDQDLKPICTEPKLDLQNLSLEEVIERALHANRNIVSSRQEVEKARGRVIQARAIGAPRLSGKHLHTRVDDVGKINFAGQSLEMGKKNISKSYLEATQPLYLGGKDKAAVNSAKLGRGISEASLILTQQNIVMKITLEYWGWIYAREVEMVGQKDLELAQAHYNLVKTRFENSMASKYELLRADVRLAQAKSALIKHKNNTQLAQLTLLNSLVLPLETNPQTKHRLEMDEFTPNPDKELDQAYKIREDLEIKRLQKRVADSGVDSAFAEKRPSLVLFGQFGSEDPSSKSSMGAYERKNYWNAGVSLEFPILDGGLSSGKIKEARASLKQSENNFQDATEQVELEVQSTALSLSSAAEIVAAQKENLKQAEETLRLAGVRYENGMFTQVEMFDAENAYSNSRLSYLAAVFGYQKAKASYLLATGQLGREFRLGY